MQKIRDLSNDGLTAVILEIATKGIIPVSESYGLDVVSLQGALEKQYNRLQGEFVAERKMLPHSCSLSWVKYATIDPEYIPPAYLMATLNALLSVFVIGAAMAVNGMGGDMLNIGNLESFVDDITNQAQAECEDEVCCAENAHKVCHIVSLMSSFSITLLQSLSAFLDVRYQDTKHYTLQADRNLCGLVSCSNEFTGNLKGDATPAHNVTAVRNIKRHGNVISQKEIADMTRASVGSINETLRLIEKALADCKVASAVDAARSAGVDIDAYVPADKPIDADSEFWYTEEEAMKFLHVSNLLNLPEKYQPDCVVRNGKRFWHEDELIRISDAMEADRCTCGA